MTTQTLSIGYTASVQRLVWPSGTNVPVTAYLWGGGGGAGAYDGGSGGAGSGGGFTEVSFLVSAGDVIDIAVGGGGGGGTVGSASPGGSAGASYTATTVFNSRTAAASPPVIASTNSAYIGFLNTYGVWVNPVTATNFDRSYTVNFPSSGSYTFVSSCDNYGTIYLDDEAVLDVPGFKSTYSTTRSVSAGDHTVRIVGTNTGGPGSIALTINGGSSYSGGVGGRPGPSGYSGAGGGGGGATVILKNGTPLAVAGGGGGGGGAGRVSSGASAPGAAGQAGDSTAGQNGQNHPGDGGGGGAGGGGGLVNGGGNGGSVGDGDVGAAAGSYGLSTFPGSDPSGRLAGGRTNPFYPGSAGNGGAPNSGGGTNGAAVILFDIPGQFVHDGTSFKPIAATWIKVNDEWQQAQSVYVKADGVWAATLGSFAPTFVKVSGNFGTSPRTF